jgi:hypothetical protein
LSIGQRLLPLKQRTLDLLRPVRERLTPNRKRRLWQILTGLSLGLLTIALVLTWRELPAEQRTLRLDYLAVAIAIYVVTYFMHLVGWHSLATIMVGRFPLKENARAVALSDLLKYLPTVVWYIANRVHFYERFNASRRSVVAASFLELLIMVGTGAVLYLLLWLRSLDTSWLGFVGIVLVAVLILRGMEGRPREWWREHVASRLADTDGSRLGHWLTAILLYGTTWLLGAAFLGATIGTFASIEMSQAPSLLSMWLVAGIAGYVVSLSLGTIGIAREATLTFLIAQSWTLPVAIATAIMVKLLLTAGQIGCDFLVLGFLRLHDRVST